MQTNDALRAAKPQFPADQGAVRTETIPTIQQEDGIRLPQMFLNYSPHAFEGKLMASSIRIQPNSTEQPCKDLIPADPYDTWMLSDSFFTERRFAGSLGADCQKYSSHE